MATTTHLVAHALVCFPFTQWVLKCLLVLGTEDQGWNEGELSEALALGKRVAKTQ